MIPPLSRLDDIDTIPRSSRPVDMEILLSRLADMETLLLLMATTSDTLPRSMLLVMTESTPIPSSTTTVMDIDTVGPFISSLATLETESGSSLEVRWRRKSLRHFTSDPTITMDIMVTDITEVDTGTAEMADVMRTTSRSSPITSET